MLIIVEGPDGCGKTTLIEKLTEVLQREQPGEKIERLRKGPPKQQPLDEYVTPLLSYRPQRGHHIICDRWHVGEWVYPSIIGRKTFADKATWYYTEMFLASRGAFVIYPTYTMDLLTRWFTDRGDDFIKVEQLAKIAGAYAFMEDKHLTVNTRVNGKSPEALIALARHRENMTERLNPFTTYIGPPRPEWLLVGERRNKTYDGDPRPAFMPYRGTSGHYLLSALTVAQLRSGLGIMNACDVDDAVLAQYFTFQDVPTVPLGNHAHKMMNDDRVLDGHPGAPHPQYVRRFHNKHGDAYAGVINRARFGEEMITWRPETNT
jgi:energy-coupling factor transporter ATP-binding protein EcfA2